MLFLEKARLVMTKGKISDTAALEKQIDEMVWAGRNLPLQGLTPEEIAIVEGK